MYLLFILTLISPINTVIIDYIRENYILIENDDALIYKEYNDILHITNLTHYENVLTEEKLYFNQQKAKHYFNQAEYLDTEKEVELAETLLNQLINKRFKRRINELGTIWKWITGTPDHDDMVQITNKINDLIENNNKQYTTNSELFKTIKKTKFNSRKFSR